MLLNILTSQIYTNKTLIISGSKSETNRLLLLQALYPEICIENRSTSDDSILMHQALNSELSTLDIHHAGTAMRFLTAYFSIQEGKEVVLTGSERMKQRPIYILVDALKALGASIEYMENPGFPPLKIKGKNLNNAKVSLEANVSSQYISALLLIAPKLPKGLEIEVKGKITSRPYIEMTLQLLNKIGVETYFKENLIKVLPKKESNEPLHITVESDWSSASYFYSIIALSKPNTKIHLKYYQMHSLQGDSVLAELYEHFGVKTIYEQNGITLTKYQNANSSITFDLNSCPDIAQTIAVTAFALGLPCSLYGLHTLKIKETDRLSALKTEIEKLGGNVTITEEAIHIQASSHINPQVTLETYNDHRMAMAFAPLALKSSLQINHAEVVSKSYPGFWEDLKSIGFQITQ